MPEKRPPDLDTFSRQFRQKYGRDMTPEEMRFYQLTKDLLDNPPEEDKGGEAA
ncbi:MAG: hypothetical protein WCC87_21205 [Candidatus Korobacteraceae bacterium]